MPEPLHPPYGQVQPRVLNRWLDVNSQNGPLGRAETFITIPTFDINVPYTDKPYPFIVGVIEYTNLPNRFSFKNLPTVWNLTNCFLCISFDRTPAGEIDHRTARYQLSPQLGDYPPLGYIEKYVNQPIRQNNFRIEVWFDPGFDSFVSSLEPIVIYTTVRQNIDTRFGDDKELTNTQEQKTKLYAAFDWIFPVEFNQVPL